MKITVELEKEDFDAMHDVIFGATGNKPSKQDIQNLWDTMPEHIKGTALQWGCDNSVFSDSLYEWLEEIS
jgi:hypothetical protein